MKSIYSIAKGESLFMTITLVALPQLRAVVKSTACCLSVNPVAYLPSSVINKLHTKQVFHSPARQNKLLPCAASL